MPTQEIYKRDFIYMRHKDGPAEKVAVAEIETKLHAGYEQCKPPEGASEIQEVN